MSRIAVAVAVLALVGAAAALRPSSCVTPRIKDNAFDAAINARCYRVSNSAADAVVATLRVSNAFFQTHNLEVFMWDIDNTNGFDATALTVTATDGVTENAVPFTFAGEVFSGLVVLDLSAEAFEAFTFLDVQITMANTMAVPVGMSAALVSTATADNPVLQDGVTTSLNVRLDQSATISVDVEADFVTFNSLAKEVTVTFSGDQNGLPFVEIDDGFEGSAGTADPASGVDTATRTFTWTDVQVQTTKTNGNRKTLVFSFDTAASTYDFAANGPFLVGTASVTVASYPKVSSGDTFEAVNGGVYQVALPALWQAVSATSDNPSAATFAVGMSPASVTALQNTPTDPTPSQAVTVDPTGSLPDFLLLSPVQPRTPATVFVHVTLAGADSVMATVTVDAVAGECSSYVDCRDVGEANPSIRAGSSPNPVERFVHCAVLPSVGNPTVPTTSCVECLNDCDCGPSQYCHSDAGVCPVTGGGYTTCDTDSRRFLGLCRNKDPSGKILGRACRNTNLLSGTSPSSPVSPPLMDAVSLADFAQAASSPQQLPLVEGDAVSDFLSNGGVGFCGGARFYADDSVEGTGEVQLTKGARAILWQGYCYNGVCSECLGDSNTCAGAQQCIDGALAPTIVVDGTSRTFANNTVAGTMLAVVFMVIIAQCCLCCQMLQARKYRKQDRAEAGKDQDSLKVV